MSTRTSFYVRRVHVDGRGGWVGPIRSRGQAEREVAAWESCGWVAWLNEATDDVKREVRAWQRQADIRHGRVAS